MAKMTGASKIALLLLILIVPSVGYLLITTGKNNYKRLPYIGERTISEKGDTIYHSVPDFSFTNQNGEPVSWATYDDKIVVVDFFFTTCPTICPKMTTQLVRVQKKFAAQRDVKLLSFTVNPETDNVEALKDYERKFMIKDSKWNLLTGDKKKIYELAINGFKLPAGEDAMAEGGFLHSEYVMLIDKDRHIRGFYDGTNKASVDTLIDEIIVLLQQYKE